MADRIREFDWAATPVGPISSWPYCLRQALEMVLGCGFPTTLQWGPSAILFYNDAYIRLIGPRHPIALGRSIFDTFPEIRAPYEPLFDRVHRGETVVFEDLPYRYAREDRFIDTWFNMSYSPVRDERGVVAGVLAIGFETTSTRRLRESEERYRTLFDNIDDGCMIIEQLPAAPDGRHDYRYVLMNPTSTSMFGRSDLTGQTIRDNFPGEDEEWYEFYDQVIETGKPLRFERLAASQGMVLEMFIARIGDPSDKRVLVLMRNVTERRRAQDAVRQAEKLSAVGRLASSIAHEINNPLEAVTNLIYLARQTSDPPDIRKFLDWADKELRRVSLITTQTLRFHRQQSNSSLTDLAEVLDSILLLHEGRLQQAEITTVRRYRPHPRVLCRPNDIRQALGNLVTNAIEAMQFDAATRQLTVRLHGANHPRSGEAGVAVLVSDTGAGISPAAQIRLFEPFFTTREATNSGLGLWITREIVSKHGGTLRYRSRQRTPARGTLFSVFLPANSTD